jgi:hypothetical protein
MRLAGWAVSLAITAVLVGGCSQPSQRHVASAPRAASPTSLAPVICSDTSPAPTFAPAVQNDANLEIVWFKGSHKFIVRDITNILGPKTISGFDNVNDPQFVNSSEISYLNGTDLVRARLVGSPKAVVAQCVDTSAIAWNSTGTIAAYVTDNRNTSAGELHLVSGGQNRVASSMPTVPLTGCESRTCADDVDFRLMFSPNGTYISFVQNFGGPNLRLWTADGQVIKSIDSTGTDLKSRPTMSVWSGNSLYWRDDKGVEMWRDGAESLLLPGVKWIHPKASPAGKQIVYGTRDAAGTAHINLLDTKTNTSRELIKSRSEPAFLNSHLIWYQEERTCVTNDQCQPGQTTTTSGKTYIYDLQDEVEQESLIAAVWDVWPHGA